MAHIFSDDERRALAIKLRQPLPDGCQCSRAAMLGGDYVCAVCQPPADIERREAHATTVAVAVTEAAADFAPDEATVLGWHRRYQRAPAQATQTLAGVVEELLPDALAGYVDGDRDKLGDALHGIAAALLAYERTNGAPAPAAEHFRRISGRFAPRTKSRLRMRRCDRQECNRRYATASPRSRWCSPLCANRNHRAVHAVSR